MLKTHDVAKLEVINRETVNVYIKKEKLSQEKYKAVSSKAFSNTPNEGPHFKFTIGDVATFEKKIEEAQKEFANADQVSISYNNNKESYWDFILGWFFPILLLVFIWIIMMRRMGGRWWWQPNFQYWKIESYIV
jgi:AFG3 family protein